MFHSLIIDNLLRYLCISVTETRVPERLFTYRFFQFVDGVPDTDHSRVLDDYTVTDEGRVMYSIRGGILLFSTQRHVDETNR